MIHLLQRMPLGLDEYGTNPTRQLVATGEDLDDQQQTMADLSNAFTP